jgi:hypothetical protein
MQKVVPRNLLGDERVYLQIFFTKVEELKLQKQNHSIKELKKIQKHSANLRIIGAKRKNQGLFWHKTVK